MTYSAREESRFDGEPVHLYLFGGARPPLEAMLRGVNVLPGATEFGLGTTKVTRGGVTANAHAGLPVTDFVASIADLDVYAPNTRRVSIVVAWHGTDLRCGSCQIRPRVESAGGTDAPYAWRVGPVDRSTAQVVSLISGEPAYGGAPADRSVYEAIVHCKALGYEVTVYPFILMDIPTGNGLADPYGESEQAAYPWRGRITCHPAPGEVGTVDKTSTAATQVNTFFGTAATGDFGWDGTNLRVTYTGPNEWSYRRFILHLATIADAADADDFLIGSEMVGLTTVRSSATAYPAVTQLITLATDVSTILGTGVRVSYAADWSEYHSHRPTDGSNDVLFPLDALWSNSNIDYVAIDNYLPLSDWRNSGSHLDRAAGARSAHDPDYLRRNIEGGEYYDWFYANSTARTAQTRTPIDDVSVANEDWVFRQKDLRNWWRNAHHPRPGGTRSGTPTSWVAQSKPIVFTEIGCPAINNGANQPNVFVDPKSSESATPYFSNGVQDPAMLRAYVEAWLDYWRPGTGRNPVSTVYSAPMIEWESISVWAWDARPYPVFPRLSDVWGDAGNWAKGHWLTGRLAGNASFLAGQIGPFAFTSGPDPITRDSVTYVPFPIAHSTISASESPDDRTVKVTIAQGSALDALFSAYPPSQPMTVSIFRGHRGDTPTPENFPSVFSGAIVGPTFTADYEVEFDIEPHSLSMRSVGLRRHYQRGCPLPLYGEDCRASRPARTVTATVDSSTAKTITLDAGITTPVGVNGYLGGTVRWTSPTTGAKEVVAIIGINVAGTILTVRGIIRDLADEVEISAGCNRSRTHCADLHQNILNYGGQDWIPIEGALSTTKSTFYSGG